MKIRDLPCEPVTIHVEHLDARTRAPLPSVVLWVEEGGMEGIGRAPLRSWDAEPGGRYHALAAARAVARGMALAGIPAIVVADEPNARRVVATFCLEENGDVGEIEPNQPSAVDRGDDEFTEEGEHMGCGDRHGRGEPCPR